MVKTIASLAVSCALLAGAALFEHLYIGAKFERFESALVQLDSKAEEGSATRADAESVEALWEDEKTKLHAMIPHGDILGIDYWLSEAVSLIEEEDYPAARSKLQVLITLARQLPKTYAISFENVF